jgi:hypothetical protein
MAIDSATKRKSSLLFGAGHTGFIDGTISAGDRRDSLGGYRGISAALALAAFSLEFVGRKPGLDFAARKPSLSINGIKPNVELIGR